MKRSTKLMACGIVLSLGWFVFAACDCDESKEDQYPGYWVACVNNKPVLMRYYGNTPDQVSDVATGNFNPMQWTCTKDSTSPQYKGSQAPAIPPGSQSGPHGYARAHQSSTGSATPATYAYLPQQLQFLPFLPDVPQPSTPPPCDSTYPDIFRTDQTLALVTRIGTCPFTVKTVIQVPQAPLQVAITPDGTTAIVTSFSGYVTFISTATNTVVYSLSVNQGINPQGIAISNDGTLAYVTSFNTSTPSVIVINIQTHQVVANINLSMIYPSGETISPDGSQLWVTSTLSTGVDVIDLLTNTLVTTLNINLATDVAFNSVGSRAYVTSAASGPGNGKVYVVNTQTYQTLSTYTVGSIPADILMSYGDQFLTVANSGDGTVSVIDLIQNQVKTTTAAPGSTISGLTWVH
jgi:DNA-binding beta-propeller fold protein YncE